MTWTPSTDPCDGECMCQRPVDWKEFTAALEDLCVEKGGKCDCDPCLCEDSAKPGW